MAQELLFLRARADAEPEWSADGSISVEDAVARVLELHPGADRLALQTLANALAHPAPSSMRLVPEEASGMAPKGWRPVPVHPDGGPTLAWVNALHDKIYSNPKRSHYECEKLIIEVLAAAPEAK